MTLLKEFFDISKQNEKIFEGVSIMNTRYRNMINIKTEVVQKRKPFERCLQENFSTTLQRKTHDAWKRNELTKNGENEKNLTI